MKNRNLPLKVAAFFALASSSFIFGQNYKAVVKDYISKTSVSREINNFDFLINSEDKSESLKATVLNIQQTVDGVPVFGSYATALVRDEKVLHYTGDFTKNVASESEKNKKAVQPTEFLSMVLGKLNINDKESYLQQLKTDEIKTPKKVYFNGKSGLILSYQLEFAEKGTNNYWFIIADAKDGNILYKQNLTVSCNFGEHPYGRPVGTASNMMMPQSVNNINTNQAKSTGNLATSASYNVFPLPIEAPSFGSRSLLTDPWDITASPSGWQTANTTTYNITRGNNVYAYTDENSTNSVNSNTTSSTYNFDFPLDLTGNYKNYKDAAVTNLFYMNNMMHDILYRFGFTETSKNFQSFNFGKGGSQNDHVLAESRDGANIADLTQGKYNNANFSTPSDGSSGRMQMYIWLGPGPYFKYNAPSTVAGTGISPVGLGYFGSPLWNSPVTADVAISPVLEACTAPAAGSLTGKIAIAKRNGCSFNLKVKNLQSAGAIGAIIYNSPDAASSPGEVVLNMSADTTVTGTTIPSVFLKQSQGENILSMINGGQTVNVTLNLPVLDGSLDNGIMAHEYGHGLSNRLHPTVSCLSSANDLEQMGEGWSDFAALMLTMRSTDNADVPRGIGTYAINETTDGVGIRPTQYSPDFNINNYTYGATVDMTEVHDIGFVWATMLWDLHWKYVEKYGFSNDLVNNQNSGSGRVFQMVINGMKLDPCNPSFIDGRDAILAADQAATGGADKCLIWNAFAKRGLGLAASTGASKIDMTDNVEDFTVPTECILATSETGNNKQIAVYPNPAKNEFHVKASKSVLGKLNVDVYDATGKLVSSQKVSSEESISTQSLPSGVYVVKVDGLGVKYSTKLIVKK